MHSRARCVLATLLMCAPTVSAEAGDKAAAGKISMAAMVAMREKIDSCWSIPAGAVSGETILFQAKILVRLKPDGSLAEKPTVREPQKGKAFRLYAESAIRAIEKCAPYTMLRPYPHEIWSEIVVTFAPSDLNAPRPQQ
jgi:hypothetical protein